MSSNKSIAILMAAGNSRRFGSDKRLVRLAGGNSLLMASIASAKEAFDDVRVVLSRHDRPDQLDIGSQTKFIISTMSDQGLGASIADAFKVLWHEPDNTYNSAAVLLADMPWINGETYRRLELLSTPDNIVRPVFNDQPGHPVFFGRYFWESLSTHTGRSGAHHIINQFRDKLLRIPVKDPGVIQDIDYPGDLIGAYPNDPMCYG